MLSCGTLLRNASVLDGSGSAPERMDVALRGGRISAIAPSLYFSAADEIDAEGLVLAPGFIDAHTHDDISVIRTPAMLPKLSQGVTTVIVGNCGISASPVRLRGDPPDPMTLLGDAEDFRYSEFSSYIAAIDEAGPAVNVASLVGHTALRNNIMDRLDRAATGDEIESMRMQLQASLDDGALGLSTGLAYLSAHAASREEVLGLAQSLAAAGAIYVTHIRSESDGILDAVDEALGIGREVGIPVLISHLKCAGIANWGRSSEILSVLDKARSSQEIGWDCYPYAASSSTLDMRQIDPRIQITVTWSKTHPQAVGRTLAEIAAEWKVTQVEAAQRLQPAGAIYHCIAEEDMRRILCHPATMIGSDGLPNDSMPHPRFWGTFPRVLGRYSRDEALLSLPEAIHKMTGMPAQRFGLAERGLIREGYCADLTLFDPGEIIDTATFSDPMLPAKGIAGVWVNGLLSYTASGATGNRGGRFLPRARKPWIQ
jgi:N-acyl-D-amino-acid deacylase